MPANTFEFADWLAMESLRQLLNPLEIGPFFNTSYNHEFTKSYPIGASLRIPFPKQFLIDQDNTLGYTPQAILDRHADVTIDKVAKAHFEWDSIEKALKMARGREKIAKDIIKPAMTTIRNKIETDCAEWAAIHTPNVVGILGTNPTTFDAVYGAAGQRLAEISAPAGDHGVFLAPAIVRTLRATAVAQFNPSSDISKMWRKGLIGEVNGFDTYQSNSLKRHTSAIWAGTVEVTATLTGTAAISTLTLTVTSGDTFKAGDKFNIAAVNEVNAITKVSTGTLKQFSCLTTSTISGTSATITITPPIYGPGSPFQNVDALPLAGADLTMWPGTAAPTSAHTGSLGLALGENAFALVSVPLDNPAQGGTVEVSSQARDPETGISVAVLRIFDGFQRKWINRIECIYGFGDLYNDHDAVVIASA
jgi:hypothetical protein